MYPSKSVIDTLVPSNSYIHASDFGYDFEKLSEHLKLVASDLRLYSKYFAWRTKLTVVTGSKVNDRLKLCELCYRMNTMKQVRYYKSISRFFDDKCSDNLIA